MERLENTPFDHPKYLEMKSEGCGTDVQIRMTFLVYMDLTEVKNWWNVEAVPCRDLDVLLLRGHERQREPAQTIMAISSDETVTMLQIRQHLSSVKRLFDTESLVLAFVVSDLAITYFRITEGLVPPDPPEALEEKKLRRQRLWQSKQTRYIKLANMPGNFPHCNMDSKPSQTDLNITSTLQADTL